MNAKSGLACCLSLGLAALPAAMSQSTATLPASVDGRRVYMVAGGAGSVARVMEAGHESTSRTWAPLQRELAATYRVIAYDRAGLGRSEFSPRPRSARNIAEELRSALRSAGVEPPYLLVGHSAGGLYARVFASLYPDEVVGLVLVDPTPERFTARAQREFPEAYAHFDSIEQAAGGNASPGEHTEDAAWETVLLEAAASDGKFGGPVIVLSSTRADLRELGAIWTDEHRRWAAASPKRQYVRLDDVGHDIHRARPDAVREAVQRILSRR